MFPESAPARPRIERGFSLLETLLTLGVMALLLVAMFLIYPRIRDASAAREAAATIETAKARIRAVAGVRGNYAWLTQAAANTFLPAGWLYANGGGNPRVGRFPNPNNHVLFYLAGVAPPGQPSSDPAKKTRMGLHVYRLAGSGGEEFCIRFVSAMAPSVEYIFTSRPGAGHTGVLLDRLAAVETGKADLDVAALAAACQTPDDPLFLFVGR